MNGKSSTIRAQGDATLSLVEELDRFARAIVSLRKKLLVTLPVTHGDGVWWKKSIEKSKSDIAKGKYEKFSSMKDAVSYLERI